MNLFNTQQLFAGIAMDRKGVDPGTFNRLLNTSRNISADTAINIYRNNYRGALTNTLELVYPECRKIVGDACFNGLAIHYVRNHASTNPDLNQYGDQFADFLRQHIITQLAFAELPYLADLAQLEFYWHKVYYADDDSVFDFDLVSTIPESAAGSLRFTLSPALELLASQYPVYEIWQLNRDGGNTASVESIEDKAYYLVHRHDFKPVISQVDAVTWNLLHDIQCGATLQDLLRQPDNETAVSVESLLPEMINNQWVTGIISLQPR